MDKKNKVDENIEIEIIGYILIQMPGMARRATVDNTLSIDEWIFYNSENRFGSVPCRIGRT